MKKIQSIALMMAIALTGTVGFTACSSEDIIDENVVYDSNGNAGVKSEFVISIPRSVVRTTRMSGAITQNAGTEGQFRGIDNISLIPFSVTPPTGSSEKNTDIIKLGYIASNGLGKAGYINYKVYTNEFVPVGTKHFLFYGKAIDNEAEVAITSMDDKFKYGVIKPTGLTDETFINPNSVSFSLEQIVSNTTDPQAGDAAGQAIVELLTKLANIPSTADAPNDKWSTTTNLSLATLYKNFITLTTASSNSLAAILSRLYFSADRVLASDPARPLANAIRSKIEEACSSLTEGSPATLKGTYEGYPTNLGLPDGAARVSWNGSEFVDISAEYSESFKQKLTDYVYPAALWYYVSTPLKAADSKKSGKYESKSTWKEVIDNIYGDAENEVEAGTQSIALRDPVQYGVGRVETKILKMGDGTFYDRSGAEVNVDNGYTLTGFLLGGQNTARYDFSSAGTGNKPIYDRAVPSGITAKRDITTSANHTLALETIEDQVVNAALELVNNGADFMGADGIIPAGGTFYLAVRLDPKDASNYKENNNELLSRIVIKDHVTYLNVTIKNGKPHVEYVKDSDGVPIGIDTDGDGTPDDVKIDVNGDGTPDTFIPDPEHGGPGWDTDGDGDVDIPVTPDPDTDEYPDSPYNPEGLGTATNGIPDLSSPSIEVGTSVDLEWQDGLVLNPSI